jgi:hypothetical protein
MFCLLPWQSRLSVTNMAYWCCAKTVIATDVINGSFESLFHLISGKLKLVTPKSPNFWGEWEVPAKNPKFRVHFFNLWRNYACYQKNYNGTVRDALSKNFYLTPSPKKWGSTTPKKNFNFLDLRVKGTRYQQTWNETLLGSQGRSFRKYQHDPCDLTPSPKMGGRSTMKLLFFDLRVNGTRYPKTFNETRLESQGRPFQKWLPWHVSFMRF